MPNVRKIFQTSADNFGDTMIGDVGKLGFKVPEYQRPYDWDRKNVQRLLQDCLIGFYRAAESETEEYTFLGTIILSENLDREHSYEPQPLLIVDGQQRLTTLLLLTCVLYKAIKDYRTVIHKLKNEDVEKWLEQECEKLLDDLCRCTTVNKESTSGGTFIPRFMRTEDNFSIGSDNTSIHSAVAIFLKAFGQYCRDSKTDFAIKDIELTTGGEHLRNNYDYINESIINYVYKGSHDDEDIPIVTKDHFKRRNCKQLFCVTISQEDKDKFAQNIANSPETEGLVRLLLFASYLLNYVVLASVVAHDEDIAFDIFDALNTTGEPLSALETLKPNIIHFERTRGGTRDQNHSHHGGRLNQTFSRNTRSQADAKGRRKSWLLPSLCIIWEKS